MIKVYSGVKGFASLLFFIAGSILFLSIFFWGFTKCDPVAPSVIDRLILPVDHHFFVGNSPGDFC